MTKLYLMHHKPEAIAVPISATMGVHFLARERGVRDAWLDLFLKHLPEEVLAQARKQAKEFRPTRMRPMNTSTAGKGSIMTRPGTHGHLKGATGNGNVTPGNRP